ALLLSQPIRVDTRQGPDQGGLPVVDVPRGSNDVHRSNASCRRSHFMVPNVRSRLLRPPAEPPGGPLAAGGLLRVERSAGQEGASPLRLARPPPDHPGAGGEPACRGLQAAGAPGRPWAVPAPEGSRRPRGSGSLPPGPSPRPEGPVGPGGPAARPAPGGRP